MFIVELLNNKKISKKIDSATSYELKFTEKSQQCMLMSYMSCRAYSWCLILHEGREHVSKAFDLR